MVAAGPFHRKKEIHHGSTEEKNIQITQEHEKSP